MAIWLTIDLYEKWPCNIASFKIIYSDLEVIDE